MDEESSCSRLQFSVDLVCGLVQSCLSVRLTKQDLFDRLIELGMNNGVVRTVVVSIAISCGVKHYFDPRVLREVGIVGKTLECRQSEARVQLAGLYFGAGHVFDQLPGCLGMLCVGIACPTGSDIGGQH